MKKISLLFFVTIAIFALSSCGGGSNDEGKSELKMTQVSLAEKGIPVEFMAPEGAEIKEGLVNGNFDGVAYLNYEVTIDDFIMDVQMEDIDLENDMATYLKFAKEIETTGDDFVEFVKEEEDGYIAKLKSEDGDNYAFCHILIKDKRAIEFSEGLKLSNYTLAQIETLYNAAKAAK